MSTATNNTNALFYRIHILLHAESISDVPTAILTLDTLKIGFPTTSSISLWMTSTSEPFFREAAPQLWEKFPILINPWCDADHANWMECVFDTYSYNNDPLIFLDGDLIFYKDMEPLIEAHIECNPESFMAGHLIAPAIRCYMEWVERLHTSFLIFPRPSDLKQHINNCPHQTRWTPVKFFPPQVVFGTDSNHAKPRARFYDTAANLFHALPEWRTSSFSRYFHQGYAHLFCGSSFSAVAAALPPDECDQLSKRHQLALKDPIALQGTNEDYERFMFNSPNQSNQPNHANPSLPS